jgi:bacillithiol system protein YtxJ
MELSKDKPVAILKHSTRCGISAMATNGLKEDWDLTQDQVLFYYLDLLVYRDVSNAVAAHLRVPHQSPQLIVLKDGKVAYTASHHMIDCPSLKRALLATG